MHIKKPNRKDVKSMADKNMISYLYYKKLEDELFKFEDSTLSEL